MLVCSIGDALYLSIADDRECANLTVCNSQQYEDTAPTATSNRVCLNGSATCPSGHTGRTVLIKTVAGSNIRADSCVQRCLFVCCDVVSIWHRLRAHLTSIQVLCRGDAIFRGRAVAAPVTICPP